jgi:hypothetical protein
VSSIYDKVIHALKQAENHNSQVMVRPEVILWPDPESQWAEVIPVLQEELPHLLVFGPYHPEKKQGPAIWLKCMVALALPEANWSASAIPILYLPGVAKSDLRNVENAVFNFQPLVEYQYTGTLFLQENGKEWSILAFVENPHLGLGIQVAKDNATREALRKNLQSIFQDKEVLANKKFIDANFLNNQLFPDIIPSVLKWMCRGDAFLETMEKGKREVFINLCVSQYEFQPDHNNIKAIALKLGSQKGAWAHVWQFYATAPGRFIELEAFLRLAKPADLGIGMYALPEESWPQVNEEKESALAQALAKCAKLEMPKALKNLQELEKAHGLRRKWVWAEMEKSPLANAIKPLCKMAELAVENYASETVEDLKNYYIKKGILIDQAMRKAMLMVKTQEHKKLVESIISLFYQPWLVKITEKFQRLAESNAALFQASEETSGQDSFILFVDAFRYELAEEFYQIQKEKGWEIELKSGWSAIPSVTPTAKPAVSPMAGLVSGLSKIIDFQPELSDNRQVNTQVFREALQASGYKYVKQAEDISGSEKYWQEIGDIDKQGHQEQANLVKRTRELFDKIEETLERAFQSGIKKVKIVTDHGWLLLPGGLPKTNLNQNLTETRWGRCALIKENASTDLLHLPWRWNPKIFIAYAPGISFFKANEEYAHGGISLHECLVPEMWVENPLKTQYEAEITLIKWVNLKCVIETSQVPNGFMADIRTRYDDPTSSIVLSPNKTLMDSRISLMVSEEAEMKAANVVLMDENGRILATRLTTVGL